MKKHLIPSIAYKWEFVYSGNNYITTIKTYGKTWADISFALCNSDEQQILEKLNPILREIEKLNNLEIGSLGIREKLDW